MKILLKGLTIGLAILSLAGCTSMYTGAQEEQALNIPEHSPFSRIEKGMSEKAVIDLLGEPRDQKVYATWQAYIPLAGLFLPDTSEKAFYYKGEGIIVLCFNAASPNPTVKEVYYNPTETGYAHS